MVPPSEQEERNETLLCSTNRKVSYGTDPTDETYTGRDIEEDTNGGLTSEERAYLEKIATTNTVYTLFKRLCVYFHGQCHLEEIMWRENVSRSELRTVLTTYQNIIVCCIHE